MEFGGEWASQSERQKNRQANKRGVHWQRGEAQPSPVASPKHRLLSVSVLKDCFFKREFVFFTKKKEFAFLHFLVQKVVFFGKNIGGFQRVMLIKSSFLLVKEKIYAV